MRRPNSAPCRRLAQPLFRVALAASLTVLGCRTTEPVALDGAFPRVNIDEAASELVVENATNADLMKRLMVEAMREAVEWADLPGPPRSARFQGRAKVYANTNWAVGFLSVLPGALIGAIAWLPIGTIEVDFTMELDVEGIRYRGRGVAEHDQYYEKSATDIWLNEAASLAAKAALADAAARGPQP